MTDQFRDKVCVVTGAASGIGRAVALNLARQGAALALSDVNAEGLEETRAMIAAPGSNRIRTDVLDVSDAEAVSAYAAAVRDGLGAADAVFNIAGLTRMGRFDETPSASFDMVMDVNFRGVVHMCRAFLDQLVQRKGTLVNISSVFGFIGYAGQAHYCASKFAVRGFTETLASELAEQGVKVVSVHPGGIATAIARNAEIDALPKNAVDRREVEERFASVARTSPEKAAEVILAGAARGKRRVLIGADAHVISIVQRLFPQSYNVILSRLFPQQ